MAAIEQLDDVALTVTRDALAQIIDERSSEVPAALHRALLMAVDEVLSPSDGSSSTYLGEPDIRNVTWLQAFVTELAYELARYIDPCEAEEFGRTLCHRVLAALEQTAIAA